MTMLTDAFWPLLLGIFVMACTAPFFLNVQVLISTRWFPDSERQLAVGLLSASHFIGNLLSFGLTAVIFKGTTSSSELIDNLHLILKTQTVAVIATFMFF